jgi:hypothetical protein
MTMAEHEEAKTCYNPKTTCPHCNYVMEQQVAPLRFKLLGGEAAWGPSAANPDAYGISEGEMNSNLDMEKRIEDVTCEMTARDKRTREV